MTRANRNGPRIFAAFEPERIRLEASAEELPAATRLEALRLLARVAERHRHHGAA